MNQAPHSPSLLPRGSRDCASLLLASLNPEQRQAVAHPAGPLLVVAGAGSGKTRVLTYRVAYLIRVRGVPASRILAVTFTNKAAGEMKERVAALVGQGGGGLWIGTFHSICAQILRQQAARLGFTSHFAILDTTDQLAVLKHCLQQAGLDPKRMEPRVVLSQISRQKNELVGPVQYAEDQKDPYRRQIARIYRLYQERLQSSNAMDFDDLLFHTVTLFRNYPDVLSYYQERFDHVLVDEYQDTNHAQYVLIKMLAALHRNICVVGDDDQSIYGFRGADVRNILDFERDYPDTTVIKLEQNYRSTKRILQAANQVIVHNRSRKDKTLRTKNSLGDLIKVYEAPDDRYEASFVANEIRSLTSLNSLTSLTQARSTGDPAHPQHHYRDFTILYRTHAQSRTFEEEFIHRGIPYRIVAGVRFYERKEIKDIVAYLRVLANPHDDLSLIRIVNVPKRGVGETSVRHLQDWATARGLPLWEAMMAAAQPAKGETKEQPIRGKAVAGLAQLVSQLTRLRSQLDAHLAQANTNGPGLADFVSQVLDQIGYQAELAADPSPEAEGRLENVREFLNMVRQFELQNPESDLDGLLEHIALVSDVDAYDRQANAVTMMTFHSAKGLEFPIVFMVGMEDGIFPHIRLDSESEFGPTAQYGDRQQEELEEERRLCYVGITRAKERLYFTHARWRFRYGATIQCQPSCFLQEIDPSLLEPVSLGTSYESSRGVSATSLSAAGCGRGIDGPGSGVGRADDATRARTPSLSRPDAAGGRQGRTYVTRVSGRIPTPAPSRPARPGYLPPGYRWSGLSGQSRDGWLSPDAQPVQRTQAAQPVSPAAATAAADWKPGDPIFHERFGLGEVVALNPVPGDAFISVRFPGQPVRKFLLSLAPLRRPEGEE